MEGIGKGGHNARRLDALGGFIRDPDQDRELCLSCLLVYAQARRFMFPTHATLFIPSSKDIARTAALATTPQKSPRSCSRLASLFAPCAAPPPPQSPSSPSLLAFPSTPPPHDLPREEGKKKRVDGLGAIFFVPLFLLLPGFADRQMGKRIKKIKHPTPSAITGTISIVPRSLPAATPAHPFPFLAYPAQPSPVVMAKERLWLRTDGQFFVVLECVCVLEFGVRVRVRVCVYLCLCVCEHSKRKSSAFSAIHEAGTCFDGRKKGIATCRPKNLLIIFVPCWYALWRVSKRSKKKAPSFFDFDEPCPEP